MAQVKIVRSMVLCLGFTMLLTACQQAEAPATQESEAAPADPEAKPGISGDAGRLVLPVVPGRPAAVYFTVRNSGSETVTLAAVHVAGAREAQMHETRGGSMSAVKSLPIEPGGSLEFAPGGLHAMAFDLDDSLKEGSTSELTLTFADGDKLSMPLRIEAMGGAMSEATHMPGMDH